jgi:hypothetical protein
MTFDINSIENWFHRFNISDEEAARIAEVVDTETEFVAVWVSEIWWTDDNNN